EDVLCEHGAAIGQLDNQASYDMAARGIPPETARKLLWQVFIGDAFVALDDEKMRDEMMERSLAQLDGAQLDGATL
ncbi:MAG: SufD family Fe-S cluster assembly protein, partial [Robiginitomaculum sp.]|nr:SufD family Fe-S cluster assembly protein [Robiginitomaculum sp.]